MAKKLLAGVLSFCIALLLLESLARIAWTITTDVASADPLETQWYAYHPEFGWTGKPGFSGRVVAREGSERTFDSTGFVIGELAKFSNAQSKKILFIGDSNMFGFDLPREASFVSIADSMLENACS